jgi:hypothetical protein
VALADKRRAIRTLSQVDGQTLSFPASGFTYLPLPPGAAFGLTGLLSVDLPDTVRKGEVYKIIVRQVTDAVGEPPIEIQIAKGRSSSKAETAPGQLRWRQVVGSYQITIPVRIKDRILPRETRLLAVLKWILESLSAQDRWFPVFSRYVDMIADRVGALGGNPDDVEPSPTGAPVRAPHEHERALAFDGKVAGIIYDCFGDFEGFLVDDCGDEVCFHSREREMESLVRLAWRERIAITVTARPSTPHRPSSIILRRPPTPYCDR